MMSSQKWLITTIVAVLATITYGSQSSRFINDLHSNEVHLTKEKVNSNKLSTTKEDVIHIGSKLPLGQDPRFNKMISNNKSSSSSTDENISDVSYDYDYDEYYGDEIISSENTTVTKVQSTTTRTTKTNLPVNKKDKIDIKSFDHLPENTEDDNDQIEPDIEDEEEVVFSKNMPCPRDCVCARNVNSYMVATCSRLDADVQKFGSDITDLVVVDIGPKYPILLGPEFFKKIGLKHVSSIKISNCTIEYIHMTAFNGLDVLYAVNLTNVGLNMIYPDTFAKNPRLRLLTITGNNLSEMSRKNSLYKHYMLKAPSVEELDLSNNNLQELLPNSFNKLSNLVYMNLGHNKLKSLPENIFDHVETIEELDLSFNSFTTLPEKIFNKTALAILNLKNNKINGDLRFVTRDIQQLDLSYCEIKNITNHMFDKTDGITTLNLKGNNIRKIQPEAFLSLRNLRHIDLSFNDLDQISALQFIKNSELDVIRLNDNTRLSQLPTDGFQSYTGEFNVYYFDISNCAIGALGYKTFSTMPHITTLKMSWNNINNLDKRTFVYLNKLIDLDLSNNLIVKLDESIFLQNHELTKINLSGNPIKRITTKLFSPLRTLKELDVSECELHLLLINNHIKSEHFKFFDTLRVFNASNNQIRKLNKTDIQSFNNLKVFDIWNNPIKCNDEFRSFIKILNSKEIHATKEPESANLDAYYINSVVKKAETWDDFATIICRHSAEDFNLNKNFEKDITPTKVNITTINENKEDLEEDTSLDEEDNETDDNNEYSDDDDYDEDEKDEDINIKEPLVKEKGIFVDEVNLLQETEDKILEGKFMNDDDILIEQSGKVYYTNYNFFWPILVIVLSITILVLVIAKIVSKLMRKRGERYRQALLASKNSIVYQKLSEEIYAPRTPKIHRYAPINQV